MAKGLDGTPPLCMGSLLPTGGSGTRGACCVFRSERGGGLEDDNWTAGFVFVTVVVGASSRRC